MGYKLQRIYVGSDKVRPVTTPTRNGDLSKATVQNRTSFTPTRQGRVQEIFFNDDGTKMFLGEDGYGIVQVWTLSTPRDITTAGNKVSLSLGWSNSPNPFFCDDGNKFFCRDGNANTFYRFDLSTPYDISGIDISHPDYSCNIPDAYSPAFQSASADGKTYIFRAGETTALSYITVADAREPAGSQTRLLTGTNNVRSGVFCDDGNYLIASDGTTLQKYEMSTPYDVTTLNTTPVQTQSTGLSGFILGIYVDKYGENIYITTVDQQQVNNIVYRYHLV